MMHETPALILLLAGTAVFLYGMQMASQSLEKLMTNRLTKLMNQLSDSPFIAIVVGVSLTTLLQSSGAVTTMLVGLGSARVISLQQVMGVIIGTAIGSTVTVQIMSFNLAQYALPAFAFFFFIFFMSKKPGIKTALMIFMGFYFMFWGLGMISDSAKIFATNEIFRSSLQMLKDNHGLSILISTLFCALVHSSAATIGLAMSLTQAGLLGPQDAMMWVYGANVGTTSTALIAAVGSNHIGKQVAWAHFFYKFFSVVFFLVGPTTYYLIEFLQKFETTAFRMIANGHLIFNLVSAVIFYPFIRPAARVIEKIFPKDPKTEFATEYLSLNNYQSAALAISYSNREILRAADIVMSMIKDSISLFDRFDHALLESIKDRDNQVDFLYRETKMFLLDHANKSQVTVHQKIMFMIMFLSDLERAADSIDLNILQLAVKKNALKLEFSNEGKSELHELHQMAIKVASMAINAFNNREMCSEVIQLKRELARLEITMREHHIERLNRGMKESINTSSIHLDLISEYKRIGSLLSTHCYTQTDPQ
jgi:phosphate:Na+ symporter